MAPSTPAPETLQPHQERPVFLAENGRRARILGIGAKVAFVLTALWLVALAAGMLGFGHLPGTRIDKPFNRLIGGGGGDEPKKQAPSTDSASVTGSPSERPTGARTQATVVKRSIRAGTPPVRGRSARRVRRAPLTRPPAGRVARLARQRSLARTGHVVPPGQALKAQPPPPPPAQPGNGYGRAKKATTNPPPPPPPGNGIGNGGGKSTQR